MRWNTKGTRWTCAQRRTGRHRHVQRCPRPQQPFSAVITDLGMPHVDGRQVAAAIKTIERTARVIMLTGWGQLLADGTDVPADVDRVLSKPPNMWELREALVQPVEA